MQHCLNRVGIGLTALALSVVVSASESRSPDPLLEAELELLALHEEAMRAHRQSDVDLLLQSDAPDFVSASRGEITRPTLDDRRERFQRYLASTRFSEYVDLVPPVVRVSRDGSLGWVIAQVRGTGVQTTQDGGSKPLTFESAWIELYERRGDTWLRAGNVSNFKP